MNYRVVLRVLSFVTLVITAFMVIPLVFALFNPNGVTEIISKPETFAAWLWSLTVGLAISLVLSLAGGAWFRLGAVFTADPTMETISARSLAEALWGANVGSRGLSNDIGLREGAAIVSFAWVLASVVGGLPYMLSGVLPSFPDAFFETMSGFSTTGATVMTDIESAPDSILLWRGLTHWIGGMGIIVLSLVALPLLGLNGMALFRSETPGPTAEKLTPRLQRTALALWGIYAGLTLLETVCLKFCGMSLFEAVIHSFSTIATGGFSTRNASIAAFRTGDTAGNAALIEWVITFFMFVAGINFAIHFHVLRHCVRSLAHARDLAKVTVSNISNSGDKAIAPVTTLTVILTVLWRVVKRVCHHLRVIFTSRAELGDQEFHAYTQIVVGAALLISLCVWLVPPVSLPTGSDGWSLLTSIRSALFHVVSLITTTGFVADDYALWPQFTQFVLLFVMVIGACAGSTGGGCKVVRFQMMGAGVRMEMSRLLHPRAVITARMNDKPVPNERIESAGAFLMVYLAILVVATMTIMLLGVDDVRLDITTSFSGVIACLSNVGPGLVHLGPTANFAWLSGAAKIILALCMLVGRLELFTVLLLLLPGTWRR